MYRLVNESQDVIEWLSLEQQKGMIDSSIEVVHLSPDERLRHCATSGRPQMGFGWSLPEMGSSRPNEHLLRSVRHA